MFFSLLLILKLKLYNEIKISLLNGYLSIKFVLMKLKPWQLYYKLKDFIKVLHALKLI